MSSSLTLSSSASALLFPVTSTLCFPHSFRFSLKGMHHESPQNCSWMGPMFELLNRRQRKKMRERYGVKERSRERKIMTDRMK